MTFVLGEKITEVGPVEKSHSGMSCVDKIRSIRSKITCNTVRRITFSGNCQTNLHFRYSGWDVIARGVVQYENFDI